jgi:hypothetical protein
VSTTAAVCTLPEMILLAAWELEEGGKTPFSAEALVVTSWQKFPRAFGLKGFAESYPDSNKVLASIMGQKGLARRAWLVKMGTKQYALTREGRLAARRMLQDQTDIEEVPAPTVVVQTIALTAEQEKQLVALFDSTALGKFADGRKFECTFADACRFWNITDNLHGPALEKHLAKFQDELTELKRCLGTGRTALPTGRSVTADDIASLGQVHAFLEKKFTPILTLLRNRSSRS